MVITHDYFLTNLCMYMDMCFACIAVVLTNHSGWRIGSYKHKSCCVLCIKFMCLIEMCGLLIVYILYQEVSNREIFLRIYGLQALSSALYPPTIVLALTPYCIITKLLPSQKLTVKSFDVWLHWLYLID